MSRGKHIIHSVNYIPYGKSRADPIRKAFGKRTRPKMWFALKGPKSKECPQLENCFALKESKSKESPLT